ncbi:MAG: DegV family protein, partial [Chloroflexota bacterium]
MAKGKITILTDSTAYLPEKLIKEYGIEVIPLNVIWEGTNYLDNVDISSEEFYTRIKTAKELPTTSQPSVGAFKEYYDRIAKDSDGIVAVLLANKLSGTIASATGAKELMEGFPIEIVDTKTTTGGLALVVVEAAKAVAAGKDLAAVAAHARDISKKTKTMFLVDTLEFLHKGGRIGGAKRLVGSMLSMKPILQLVEGVIDPLDSVRTKKKAVAALLEIAKQDIATKEGTVHAVVFHGLAEAEATLVRDRVAEMFSPETLLLSDLSPVIGTHTGPGAIGIAYFV